jgi:hypothetical protein
MATPSVSNACGRKTIPLSVYHKVGFFNLLTPDGYSPKLKKGRAKGYASYILHLAPSRMSGHNVCGAFATEQCIEACLNTAGRGGINLAQKGTNSVQAARLARTKLFFEDPFTFMWILEVEIETAIRRSARNGRIPCFRLNGTSDLSWENMRFNSGERVFDVFSQVQFYDYTKNPARAVKNASGQHPANYGLCFSRSEKNDAECMRVLATGGNVAVVFDAAPHCLPDIWRGYRVIDGDQDDLRFLDPRGVIVGLSAKGRAIGTGTADGFVVNPSLALPLAYNSQSLAA